MDNLPVPSDHRSTITVGDGDSLSAAPRAAHPVASPPRHVAPRVAGPPPRLPSIDAAALEGLPAGFEALAEDAVPQLAYDLAHQGARGPAARAALARDAAISSARLRAMQSQQAVLLGGEDLGRVLQFERLIEAEHRRWMAALDMLARLDPPPATAVRITANQAAVTVNNK